MEGAFLQGLGLFTLEQLHYSPQGVLLTRGPGSYKIPAFGDIPTHLTVSLLRDAPNDKAIFASKVPTLRGHCCHCQRTKNIWSWKCINAKSCFRRWASLLCFWQRPSFTPSKMPSAQLVQSRPSLGPSASTAQPRQRGSGTHAPISSPNWYETWFSRSLLWGVQVLRLRKKLFGGFNLKHGSKSNLTLQKFD